jgi:hypothetical protein
VVKEHAGGTASCSRRIEFKQLSSSDLSAETPQRLDALLQEQGYLYFRGVFDTRDVAETRAGIIGVLAKNGLVKPGFERVDVELARQRGPGMYGDPASVH